MVRSSNRGVSRPGRVSRRDASVVRPFRRTRLESLEPRWVLAAPTLAALSDITLYSGAPLCLGLDAFDADGDTLTFSISSTNAALTATVPEGNRSLKMTVAGYGDMIFELFEDLTPETTARIIQLAQSGFYDDLTFHRIIENFMIQGGDPDGDGTGGSGVSFDDEFNVLLRHTGVGVLSMANSGDDTNDSQFFITSGPARHLDFAHTVFGQLTQGETVRQAIAAVDTDSSDEPLTPVVIDSISVYFDHENGVLRLSAPEGTTGEADVTVTVSDGNGGTAVRTFHVTIAADTVNDAPYLGPIADIVTTADTPVTFNIPGLDVDGGTLTYSGEILSGSGTLGLTGDTTTGAATVTPTGGPGIYSIKVSVTGSSRTDSQIVPVIVKPTAPTNLDLSTSSDTGSGTADGVTSLDNTTGKTLSFWVSGLTVGAEVAIYADGQLIGSTTATSATALIITNGTVALSDGDHVITAVQTLNDQVLNVGNRDETLDLVSPTSASFILTVDTTPPEITSTAVTEALAGVQYVYDLSSDAETAGQAVYSLSIAPPGMLIDGATGRITWTPTAAHGTSQTVMVRLEDLAGNNTKQTFLIEINQAPAFWEIGNQVVAEHETLAFEVVATDANGDVPLTFSLAAGAPEGATIDPATGDFSWTPTEAQGPGVYNITILATDSVGSVGQKVVQVTVTEANVAPVLGDVADASASEGQLVQFTATATDADLPANTLHYSLGEGAPTGAAIDPTTGHFTWTPGEAHGGQNVAIVVRVTDSAGAVDEQTFHVAVTEVDDPPVFAATATQTANPGTRFTARAEASDLDTPAHTIRYSLESGAPKDMTIDATTGVITWDVPEDYPVGTFTLSVRATELLAGQAEGLHAVGALRIAVSHPTAGSVDMALAVSTEATLGLEPAREAVEALLMQTAAEPTVRFTPGPVVVPQATDPLGFQLATPLRDGKVLRPKVRKPNQKNPVLPLEKDVRDSAVEPAAHQESKPADAPKPDETSRTDPASVDAILAEEAVGEAQTVESAPANVVDAALEVLADEAGSTAQAAADADGPETT